MKALNLIIAIILIAGSISVSGCSIIKGVELDPDEKWVTAGRFLARKTVKFVAMNNPEIITPGIITCKAILDASDPEVIDQLMKKIIKEYQDKNLKYISPYIKQDILDVMAMMGIEPNGEYEKLSIEAVKFIAEAALLGLKEAQYMVGIGLP